MEPGDAVALARFYLERLGVHELYVADLDAILDHPPQDSLVAAIVALGAPVWLDAGTSSAALAHRVAALGAAQVIVGLETLPSFGALREMCGGVGGERVAFSLDLRHGVAVVSPIAEGIAQDLPPHVLAARAAEAGAGAVIVLDLGRVGLGGGLDLALIRRVRRAVPWVTLVAGGGVRGAEDCERLADAGCDGALVATALHDGRLDADAVAWLQRHSSATR
jgi:phosphoribosylformimino-5-aminoimidazole carboxamide ribotide isomerase